MRTEGFAGYRSADSAITGFDFGERHRLRSGATAAERDEALKLVDEAKKSNTQTTLAMMDRHNEMVKKSQELFKIKEKKLAIERRNQENREEQTLLLARMAIKNAERSDFFMESK